DRDPVPVHHQAEQPARRDGAVEIEVERMRLSHRALEDARMQDRRTGIDEAVGAAMRARQMALRVDEKVGRAAMTGGLVGMCKHEQTIHARAVPCKSKALQIRRLPAFWPIDPERISVEDDKRSLPQQR